MQSRTFAAPRYAGAMPPPAYRQTVAEHRGATELANFDQTEARYAGRSAEVIRPFEEREEIDPISQVALGCGAQKRRGVQCEEIHSQI